MVKLKIPICLMILLCLAAAAGAADAQKMMSVQVREGLVRATPSFLGRMSGTVFYGDRVVLEGV